MNYERTKGGGMKYERKHSEVGLFIGVCCALAVEAIVIGLAVGCCMMIHGI